MNAETLLKTNPKTVCFTSTGGGVAELTSEEVAAMLYGTTDGEFYLAMTKYAGQDHKKIITHYLYKNHLPKLYQRFKMNTSERGRGKLNIEHGFLWRLIYLVVNEYIDPCRCLTCQGTMSIGDGVKEKIKACPACRGTSRSKLDDGQKSDYLKTDRFNYWRPLYERIYRLLNDWDCEALHLFGLHGMD